MLVACSDTQYRIYAPLLLIGDEFRYIGGSRTPSGLRARVDNRSERHAAGRRAASCYRVFVDTISGSLDQRPELPSVR
jgi:hypothetical protein